MYTLSPCSFLVPIKVPGKRYVYRFVCDLESMLGMTFQELQMQLRGDESSKAIKIEQQQQRMAPLLGANYAPSSPQPSYLTDMRSLTLSSSPPSYSPYSPLNSGPYQFSIWNYTSYYFLCTFLLYSNVFVYVKLWFVHTYCSSLHYYQQCVVLVVTMLTGFTSLETNKRLKYSHQLRGMKVDIYCFVFVWVSCHHLSQ